MNTLRNAQSFIELGGRERARMVLDPGGQRELLGPFDRLMSPWLARQGIVPQSDDGVVIVKGTLDGHAAVVLAVESGFQGGSIGEVSGAKIAGTLELALRDCEAGRPVWPILLLETGGVRLQEANLGLAAIAEIQSAVIALRRHVPVVGVVAGLVGCFGGMSLVAALCSRLVLTRQARLGMNGPEVIEQEAGSEELDAPSGNKRPQATGIPRRLNTTAWRHMASCSSHSISAGMPCSCTNTAVRRLPAASPSSAQSPSCTRSMGSPRAWASSRSRSAGGKVCDLGPARRWW